MGIGDATPLSIPFGTILCSSDGKETTSIHKSCFVGTCDMRECLATGYTIVRGNILRFTETIDPVFKRRPRRTAQSCGTCVATAHYICREDRPGLQEKTNVRKLRCRSSFSVYQKLNETVPYIGNPILVNKPKIVAEIQPSLSIHDFELLIDSTFEPQEYSGNPIKTGTKP
ncbi:hypothetical protein Tco_0269110 [Tanacetum coccineum]